MTFFRMSWEAILFDMSVSQVLSLIEVKSHRELRQQEEAERRAKAAENGGSSSNRRPDYDFTKETPSVSDIAAVFGPMALK